MAHFTVTDWNQPGVDLVLIQPFLLYYYYYYFNHMNLGYGLALHEFWVAQVDRAPSRCLGGHRFESCRGLRIFSLSHARDMLIISFSHKSCCPYANQHFQSSIISITKRGRFASKQGQTKSTTVEWSILSIQRFFRLIEYRGVIVKNVLLISRVGMQISIPHVRYWWLRGFMKKTANFAQLYCLPIPGRYEH